MHALPNPHADSIFQLASNSSLPKEIPDLLQALLLGVQQVLGDNLVAVYLRGSLAMGDFDPATSDIDFFAIVEQRLSEAEFADLAAMHGQLAKLPNRYAEHLEGPYIDRAAARRFQPGEHHPTIARQECLTWYEHDYNWVLERWMVREHGLTLFGPSPETLIDPVSPDDLRAAVRLRLQDWVHWADQPDDPDWLLPRSHKAYVIETMCRALYTLTTGMLASKPLSITWALATLPEPWHTIVEQSQKWHADDTIDASIHSEVVKFVHMAATTHVSPHVEKRVPEEGTD